MLRFEDVSYTYPFQDSPAVSHISLHVKPGEVVLCTGASGCGKSTLIRLANGLCPLHFAGTLEGRVLVNGVSTLEQDLPHLARQAARFFRTRNSSSLPSTWRTNWPLPWSGRACPQNRCTKP